MPRSLLELLDGIVRLPDLPEAEIGGLALDSRQVAFGDLFFALEGSQAHGRQFIDQAIERGSAAVLQEATWVKKEQRSGVPVISLPELKFKLGAIAERWYGNASQALTVIGVTGTNGKTSVSHFIAQALRADGPCGVIGTLGNGLIGNGLFDGLQFGTHTTPDAITVHGLLAGMRDAGAPQAVMEVSSHALDQGRVAGVAFDVAVFTNLSREHLDYHGDMASYGRAKRRLFETPGLKYAVINLDDDYGQSLLAGMPGAVGTVSYGFDDSRLPPSLLGADLQLNNQGLRLRIESDWGSGELSVPLLGRFNAENLLAAFAALLACGLSFDEVLARLSCVQPVPGRMQRLGGGAGEPLVVVDYAHTPDALTQVLEALRAHGAGRLICVFGCGGDRDEGKRPLMARAVELVADQVIVTDDNPRGEDPDVIVADIFSGFKTADAVTVINDRAAAIRHAVSRASEADVVLVAGKGHEDYQLLGGQRLPFNDAEQVRAALRARPGGSTTENAEGTQ
ncbi:UDP-N-acetylmuramoylalanyl-D-glutamate--2,6-diaminopimelate ligase [hydrothermal vent metagenome]|uniref:UDP-N-acetylmuramoylalanyl-D-glutamate--2,6-diaminopimelate ligase n=1 Tax=hydrothermal vent metagenome TaxID=652676 RepID=A0A3B1AJF2_9ZZZZ